MVYYQYITAVDASDQICSLNGSFSANEGKPLNPRQIEHCKYTISGLISTDKWLLYTEILFFWFQRCIVGFS